MRRLVNFGFVCFLAFTLAYEARADELSIGTWNIGGAESLLDRKEDFQDFGVFARNLDFLVLQEILSKSQVEFFVQLTGNTHWNYAISDFSDDLKRKPPQRWEVVVVSPHTITNIVEADPYPIDDSEDSKDKDQDVSVPAYIPKDQSGSRGARGWLWVEFEDMKVVIVAVHLKSSLGHSGSRDEQNSFKREAISAAIVDAIRQHTADYSGWSYVVAGDFNVAPSDAMKVGTDLELRCQTTKCTGYDQTHALFSSGLVDNFSMRNLVVGLGSSYAKKRYSSSPVDNIYVMGPRFDETRKVLAERGDTFGSDHYTIRATVWEK